MAKLLSKKINGSLKVKISLIYTRVSVVLVCFGLLIVTSSNSLAEEPMEPAKFCELSVELVESEIAEDLADGIISQAEAELELKEEIEHLGLCTCYWSELSKHVDAQYVFHLQQFELSELSVMEEIQLSQKMHEQGILSTTTALEIEEASEKIESVCGPLE